ncbi:glycosyl hydrolase [Mucilaginibacter boryungensis]|uniref:Glycosyl transferase family 2 n=1 Tax=Mucilaginibacter boryungensis TaxID=768480 RepID=A0ABR9XG24_9SPHI|nr:glycosyl hydrolase [Mucilaginibacter boryungensis]MBE9666176.1 glycosyl transferase family 2 [Mucilaginibacter boryungensis]
MNINRRKFLEVSAIGATGATLLNSKAVSAAIQGVAVIGVNDLRKNFLTPPDDTKSSCYWWWFNGLVDKEGITRDLEEYRTKGMGEVLLVNSAGGLGGVPYPQGFKLFSEEWKELYRHAMKEAKRLSIGVGVNLCSGWCMGGPWIKPENSGRWYLQSEMTVNGPQKFSGKLPLPGNRAGYDNVFNPPGFKEYIDLPLEKLDYRDTAIVAIPDNVRKINGERAAVLAAKTNHKDASNFTLATDVMGPVLYQWHNEPQDKVVAAEQVIDLTNKIDKDGQLDWEVPAGKWKIIRTGHRMTGSRLMIAQPEADGLSVDWFDHRGVELQFENWGRMLIDEAAKVGNKPKYFCDDSFEDGFPNWTERIIPQFKKYRGYDPTPYLPVLSGYIIGSADIADRFLNDYRKTLGDCMADEHYKRFAELCHKEGLLVQNESAGPSRSATICMDGLKNLGRSDFPMSEFWLGPNHQDESTLTDDKPYGTSRLDKGQNKVTKMAASAAHIYGKETVSAEAFTTMRHWVDYPGSLKQALDRAYCEGINRIAIHTSTASRPRDGKPGYEYGAGTHFNPNVTWWEKTNAFFDYVARCQYLLRSGRFVADVLFYNGDVAPNLVAQKHTDPSLGKGYDYDVCNEEVLLTRVSTKYGRIVLPDGMSYAMLVLPDTTRMPVKVLHKISELIKAGATVIGPKPLQDSGLKNFPHCDEEIKALTKQVWGNIDGKRIKQNHYGNGRMIFGDTIRQVLLSANIQPDFEYTGNEGDWLDFIHRSTPEAEIYFVINRHGKPCTSTCTFRVSKHVPELWDAVTAKVTRNVNYKVVNGRIAVTMQFDAFQSFFVVFPKANGLTPSSNQPNFPELKVAKELTGTWHVAFDTKWGGPESVAFDTLQDWSKNSDERIKYFSGKAIYHKKFEFAGASRQPVYLDLGVVKNIADVTLNGKHLGIVWTAPWRIDISQALKKGENVLEIEVINVWNNRLVGDAGLPADKRLTNTNIVYKPNAPLTASGLLGPVTILV